MSDTAAEETEDATSRKLEKQREEGNVSKSQDLNAALMATAGIALLSSLSAYIFSSLQTLFYYTFTHLNPKDIRTDDILLLFLPFAKTAGQIVVPFMLILMFAGILIVRSQVGFVFAPDKVKFNMENLAPSKMMDNLRKLFNPVEPRTMVEFAKSFIKLIVVGTTGFSVLNGRKDELYGLLGLSVNSSLAVIGSILTQMLINMCLAMIVLGLLDKQFQDFQYKKSLRMTKQEVKDESKDSEGDQNVKGKIRSIQMKMARQKMLAAVQTADVVVTNPTHYAVALKYDKKIAPAPTVIAKGVDFVAFKIREIAQSNNIPIVENRPLAQALYKLVPIDAIIPSDMFVAVAEVLAYVYNKDKK